MKDIFTDLYNKVFGFFRQAEKKEEESAKDVACNRLKFVLMQDRTNLTPELMDRMRRELIELLSKYVEMDKDALELGFEQEGTQMALMLSIPVVRAKEESEIEAVLAKEDEEKAKREAESSETSSEIENNISAEGKSENEEVTEENTDDTDDEDTMSGDITEEVSKLENSEELLVGAAVSSPISSQSKSNESASGKKEEKKHVDTISSK